MVIHDHTENIPGTVDLNYSDGEETALGLALYPVPSQDPNDPLRWPRRKKYLLLFIVSAYSFMANSTLIGASVYVNFLAQLFGRTPNETSRLVTYPNLLFGFGSLLFVPLYHKIGRRPIMLISLVVYAGGLLGCALSNSYDVLLVFRIIHGFGSSVCEALPAQVVTDIFFIHERGKALGWYTFALATGSLGALAASYMLAAGLSYNLFFWLSFAIAVLLFILTFFCFEETMYFRAPQETSNTSVESVSNASQEKEGRADMIDNAIPDQDATALVPPRKSYAQQLRLWGQTDPNTSMPIMMVRSFTYFLVPPVFWVITTYGMVIGISGLAFTATFPAIIASPPYNWPIENTGLVSIAALVGYLCAAGPFSGLPDKFAARLARRNGNIREAEYSLWCLVIVLLMQPASLILYGFAAGRQLHWITFFFSIGMFTFGAYFGMTFTLAYALESYKANVPEMLIATNLGKQAISFGFGFAIVDWITEHGYIIMFAGIFCSVMLANNLAVFAFLGFGKRMRVWVGTTWLARLHRKSIVHEGV